MRGTAKTAPEKDGRDVRCATLLRGGVVAFTGQLCNKKKRRIHEEKRVIHEVHEGKRERKREKGKDHCIWRSHLQWRAQGGWVMPLDGSYAVLWDMDGVLVDSGD